MNQYQRLYSLVSEMVWVKKGKPIPPRKFSPPVAKALRTAPRKVAKTVGNLTQRIKNINVSPEETEVDDWEAGAKKELVSAIKTSGKAPHVRGLPGMAPTVSVPKVPERTSTKAKSSGGDRGRTRQALQPESRPRGSSGSRAGRNPDNPRRR